MHYKNKLTIKFNLIFQKVRTLFVSQSITVLGVLVHLVILVIHDWSAKRSNVFLIPTVLHQQFVLTISVPLVSMVSAFNIVMQNLYI